MSGLQAAHEAAQGWARAIAGLTANRVRLSAAAVLDRSDAVALEPPGQISPNGSCRLIATSDSWIAVNLARPDDADLIPAWTGCGFGDSVWPAIARFARTQIAAALVTSGTELGLPVSALAETPPSPPLTRQMGTADTVRSAKAMKVLDLSTLWAGPLCADILAQAGHEVSKVESRTRPDPLPFSAPAHDARLNGRKQRHAIDFTAATLLPMMLAADIIVTSARPRAFAALDLAPECLFAMKPGLIWVAITGHGWAGSQAARTGFGDDAAVAGGLVNHGQEGPEFAGDALADPLTGLAAACAALQAIDQGGGMLIDAALACTAALAAAGS